MTATQLKRRLVPKLLVTHRQIGGVVRPVLVTTHQYRKRIDVGDPVSQAKIYEAQLADELIILNIDRSPLSEDDTIQELISRLASETFMPLAVGGGVRGVDDFTRLLDAGADKVTINTAALDRPSLIDEAATRFGAQCVVVSIDYRLNMSGCPIVCRDGALTMTKYAVQDWASEAATRGAGELLLTNADRDGTGIGLDLETAAAVVGSVRVPVILSGGCGVAEHFIRGFLSAGADAVAAGTFFCFRDQNPMQTRAHIRNAGVPIRMET